MAGRELAVALADWRKGVHRSLFELLGYETLETIIPERALSAFGLVGEPPLSLTVVARHGSLDVFYIRLQGKLDPESIRNIASRLHHHNPSRRVLLVFGDGDDEHLVFASWGLASDGFRLRKLWIETAAPRRSELDILEGLRAEESKTGSELALSHAEALDREGLTRRFFVEFRHHRAALADALVGIPLEHRDERSELALTILSRLLFLYFIQRKGWLNSDRGYLVKLYSSAQALGIPFYRRRLTPLFFGALNRPPELRGVRARELGTLPYLNGGLFERGGLERTYSRLDVPDEAFAPIFFNLLEHYQFTLREDQPTDQDVAVDPEMLGRVFEGLMTSDARGSTGAFYTPRVLVDRLVDGALSAHLCRQAGCPADAVRQLLGGQQVDLALETTARLREAIRNLRLLDPAVGSGSFLLAALQKIERVRDAIDGRPEDSFRRFERCKEIIERNLFGVDISAAAVRLCELRLWLALVVDLDVETIDQVPPLPNLDINIRQGDALVDPIDFVLQVGESAGVNLVGRWQREARRLAERRTRYFHASGRSKRRAGRSVHCAERKLALEFLAELAALLDSRVEDIQTECGRRDLFGSHASITLKQRRALTSLERRQRMVARLIAEVDRNQELPFFSFPIHFSGGAQPGGGFDIVVGNPPWVRAHRWTHRSRAHLKERFTFLRDAGWRRGARLAGAGRGFGAQVDLSALFLERSLDLLEGGGALGFLLPAKLVRALYGAAFRARLVTETRLHLIEDCAHATEGTFEATTYPLAVVLTRESPEPGHSVRVLVHTRSAGVMDFDVEQSQLGLLEDAAAPWILVPPDVRSVLDKMLAAGPSLGDSDEYRPRRGIFTGANDIFVGELVEGHTSQQCATVALNGHHVAIEKARLRPLLRGADVGPWRFRVRRALVWTHDDDGRVLPQLPPAIGRYLRAHRGTLDARQDLKRGQRRWTLFRTRPAKWSRRVVWRDIGQEPGAAVVPASIRFLDGRAPVISLNTLYQIPTRTPERAHFLAALLNSRVAQAFLKSMAERASGGCFRFLGWTVALLPLPVEMPAEVVSECVRLSKKAHACGAQSDAEAMRLDHFIGCLYGLDSGAVAILRRYNACLN